MKEVNTSVILDAPESRLIMAYTLSYSFWYIPYLSSLLKSEFRAPTSSFSSCNKM